MSDNVWIKLHRSILENNIWIKSEPFDCRSAWVDILLNVAYEDKKIIVGKKIVERKKGTWLTSMRALADRWHWNRRTVEKYLNLLKELEKIDFCAPPTGTLICVLNWEKYQEVAPQCAPPTAPQCAPLFYKKEDKEVDSNVVDDSSNYNQEVDTNNYAKDINNTNNNSKIIIDSKSNINQDNNNKGCDNVFTAYEKNIGMLTPIIGEQLKDLLKEVGELKVLNAIRETSLQGKHNYKYVEAVAKNFGTKKQKEENGKKINPFCPECNGTGKVIRYLDGDTSQPFEMKCPKCFKNM